LKIYTLYDVLNVPGNASADSIKSAYRKLAKEFHPDVSSSSDSTEMFVIIQNAYEILSVREKRAQYDYYLQSAGSLKGHNSFSNNNLYRLSGDTTKFSVDKILSHLNYFLWDIEIFMTRDYRNRMHLKIGQMPIKEYILRILIFIDQWILTPCGFCDYFMKSRNGTAPDFRTYLQIIAPVSKLKNSSALFQS
jgi:curved DNA-binding protein CbpA